MTIFNALYLVNFAVPCQFYHFISDHLPLIERGHHVVDHFLMRCEYKEQPIVPINGYLVSSQNDSQTV